MRATDMALLALAAVVAGLCAHFLLSESLCASAMVAAAAAALVAVFMGDADAAPRAVKGRGWLQGLGLAGALAAGTGAEARGPLDAAATVLAAEQAASASGEAFTGAASGLYDRMGAAARYFGSDPDPREAPYPGEPRAPEEPAPMYGEAYTALYANPPEPGPSPLGTRQGPRWKTAEEAAAISRADIDEQLEALRANTTALKRERDAASSRADEEEANVSAAQGERNAAIGAGVALLGAAGVGGTRLAKDRAAEAAAKISAVEKARDEAMRRAAGEEAARVAAEQAAADTIAAINVKYAEEISAVEKARDEASRRAAAEEAARAEAEQAAAATIAAINAKYAEEISAVERARDAASSRAAGEEAARAAAEQDGARIAAINVKYAEEISAVGKARDEASRRAAAEEAARAEAEQVAAATIAAINAKYAEELSAVEKARDEASSRAAAEEAARVAAEQDAARRGARNVQYAEELSAVEKARDEASSRAAVEEAARVAAEQDAARRAARNVQYAEELASSRAATEEAMMRHAEANVQARSQKVTQNEARLAELHAQLAKAVDGARAVGSDVRGRRKDARAAEAAKQDLVLSDRPLGWSADEESDEDEGSEENEESPLPSLNAAVDAPAATHTEQDEAPAAARNVEYAEELSAVEKARDEASSRAAAEEATMRRAEANAARLVRRAAQDARRAAQSRSPAPASVFDYGADYRDTETRAPLRGLAVNRVPADVLRSLAHDVDGHVLISGTQTSEREYGLKDGMRVLYANGDPVHTVASLGDTDGKVTVITQVEGRVFAEQGLVGDSRQPHAQRIAAMEREANRENNLRACEPDCGKGVQDALAEARRAGCAQRDTEFARGYNRSCAQSEEPAGLTQNQPAMSEYLEQPRAQGGPGGANAAQAGAARVAFAPRALPVPREQTGATVLLDRKAALTPVGQRRRHAPRAAAPDTGEPGSAWPVALRDTQGAPHPAQEAPAAPAPAPAPAPAAQQRVDVMGDVMDVMGMY